jgi:hypothetical protein
MTDARAILCDFTDFKRVATRNTFQLIFELPLEQAEEAIKLLGNPLPGKTLKCGIARVSSPIAQRQSTRTVQRDAMDAGSTPVGEPKEKTKWQKLRPSAQAALRCQEPEFWDYLEAEFPAHWHQADPPEPDVLAATIVRDMCGVRSRAELDRDDQAALAWADIDHRYQDWRGTHKAIQQAEAYAR